MHWVMDLRSEPLTLLFKAFTALGGIVFLGLAMSTGYWLWRKKLFAELILLYCLSGILNNHLKETFREPRPPFNPDAGVTALIDVSRTSWSFPSGHAQTAALIWGWLAVGLRIRWVYVACGAIILMVAASRVYLGVHYPIDVIAGTSIGLAGVALFLGAKAVHARLPRSFSPRVEVAVLSTVVALWLLVFPGERPAHYVFGYGGGLLGFWTGFVRDRQHWRTAPRPGPGSALGILTVGLGIPGLLYLLFGAELNEWRRQVTTVDLRALLYLAITALGGAWISLGAPAIFLRARWMRKRSAD